MRGYVGRVMQLIGSDGLYKVYIDSIGRMSTNSTITTPETSYIKESLRLNGTAGASNAMNVSGTLAAPINFRYAPTGSTVYYIESLSVVLSDDADFGLTTFGAVAALVNGVQINVRTKGQMRTIGNMQNNLDFLGCFAEHLIRFDSSGVFGIARIISGKWGLTNRITLDPSLGDYIEFKIRDNLTGLTGFRSNVEAWRIEV